MNQAQSSPIYVSKIYLVVHPIFAMAKLTYADKKVLRKLRPIVKNEFHNIGLMINDAKKDPNSIFVFILPIPTRPLSKDLERLVKRAQNELGVPRVEQLDTELGYSGYWTWTPQGSLVEK